MKANKDLTGDDYDVYAWDVVDIFFATIVASLPALDSLIDEGVRKLKSLSSSSSKSFPHKDSLTKISSPDSKDCKKSSERTISVSEEAPKVSWSHDLFVKPVFDAPDNLEVQVPTRNVWQKFRFEEVEVEAEQV